MSTIALFVALSGHDLLGTVHLFVIRRIRAIRSPIQVHAEKVDQLTVPVQLDCRSHPICDNRVVQETLFVEQKVRDVPLELQMDVLLLFDELVLRQDRGVRIASVRMVLTLPLGWA